MKTQFFLEVILRVRHHGARQSGAGFFWGRQIFFPTDGCLAPLFPSPNGEKLPPVVELPLKLYPEFALANGMPGSNG